MTEIRADLPVRHRGFDGLDPRLACAGILGSCTLAGGLVLLVEEAAEGNGFSLKILILLALLAIAGLALAGHRRFRRLPQPAAVAGLERAVTVAETANLAKSRYLANVSHEIRSPLNAIYGYAQLVERDGAIAQEAARVIRRSAEHLTSLVEGLLDISQVENGILKVRTEPARLGQFLDQLISMMRPAAAAKGLELAYEPPARLPEFVRMDQGRVRQVLINLLSNAIKFTESGRVTLRVGYAGQIATFEIIDTGPGIDPVDRDRIFEAFQRGADADERYPGAGLGLTISKAIVEILGGNLEMESAPGQGATFRVVLMLGEATGALLPETQRNHVSAYLGERRSILVVDDDAEQRIFLEQLLGSVGFTVVAVPTGEAAVDLCRERDFDLAILDISLPGISGWETAARLRERKGAGIRVLMLSANAHERHGPATGDDPAHDQFLLKPFEFEALTEAIGELLGLTWTKQGAEPQAAPTETVAAVRSVLPETAMPHIGRIRELLRIGYVRGIEDEIRQLAEDTPEASDLVEQLYACLDRFDLAGMSRTLERI